jgi:hypothetical protein
VAGAVFIFDLGLVFCVIEAVTDAGQNDQVNRLH